MAWDRRHARRAATEPHSMIGRRPFWKRNTNICVRRMTRAITTSRRAGQSEAKTEAGLPTAAAAAAPAEGATGLSRLRAHASRLIQQGSFRGRVRGYATGLLVGIALERLLRLTADMRVLHLAAIPQTNALVAAGLALVISAMWIAPAIVRLVVRWGRRKGVLPFDLTAATIGSLAAADLARGVVPADWVAPFLTLAIAAFLAIGSRFLVRALTPRPDPLTGADAYGTVLGAEGLGALRDLKSDALGRGVLVDSLESLVAQPRNPALTIGLTGPWGSGKTSILNELGKL